MVKVRLGNAERGLTYLVVLILVGVVSASLVAFAGSWSHASQRAKEAELLWVGEQFRQGIGLYYERTPGAVKRFPERLDDLLQDERYASVQRHLRRIYADPITGNASWGLIQAPGGGIMGIHSLSETRPIRSGGFSRQNQSFENATTYSNWKFVYEPPVPSVVRKSGG